MKDLGKNRSLLLSCLLFILLVGLVVPSRAQMQAEWTPAQEEGAGPLPLSQNQRQQLLQLEQSIMNSPDPSAALQQVAQQNNMDPRELADLLDRNRRDMGGGVGRRSLGTTLPRSILKLVATMVAAVAQSARHHPRSFGLVTTTILLLMYMLFSAPRTGMVLSTRRSLLSSGHSTVWNPPTKYVDRLLDSPHLSKRSLSPPLQKGLDLDLLQDLTEDGVDWIKLGRKSDMIQAVTAQVTIDVDTFLPEDDEKNDNEEEGDRAAQQEEMADLVYDSAATVLSTRRLSEFVDSPKSLRLQSSDQGRQRFAYLVIQKMGDWGRFGLEPLKLSKQQETQEETRLVYSTLRGGHFDGELVILVERVGSDKIVVRTSLAVPKKGKRLKKKLATALVSGIANSVARSTTTLAKQTLARQSQSSRYRGKAKDRAMERRRIRFENEKKQEEMARDRKRKWQRSHPDTGRYRPSGKRMQSPNNC